MIDFIKSSGPEKGIADLAGTIASLINDGKRVLWLIAGGSNIPVAAEAMNQIRRSAGPGRLSDLTVSQTDERYGPVGHSDSNWEQMIDTGFDLKDIRTTPVLDGSSLEKTVKRWSEEMSMAFDDADIVIGQFGMGADGHIAGILPHSPAVGDTMPASSHKDEKFTRVTLTPTMLKRIGKAFVFVYGDAKRKAVRDLHDKELSLDDEPAQILKSMPEVRFYTDCI